MKKNSTTGRKWLKFILGLTCLTVLVLWLSFGSIKPCLFTQVICHNLDNDFDATPLIYSEYDQMLDVEESVRERMSAVK